jgi:hypothetical protein
MDRRLIAASAALVAAACDDDAAHRAIQTEINVLVRTDDDARLALAQQRLGERGLSALPQVETSLHAAPERGRRRLVETLRMLAHPEVVPILRHLAVYDASEDVRKASVGVLSDWAARSNGPGEPARVALQRVATLRASAKVP